MDEVSRQAYMTQKMLEKLSDELFLQLIKEPLYSPVVPPAEADEHAGALFRRLRTREATYDYYCPQCKKDSVWSLVLDDEVKRLADLDDVGVEMDWANDFTLVTRCGRNQHHMATYVFDVDLNAVDEETWRFAFIITKYGQYPSLADFSAGDTERFSILSQDLRAEFKRAINTSAHGFNVAACVHYRRVFERILSEVRDEHLKDSGESTWPEFDSANTEERVKLLGNRLPDFLREHPHLYRVLSIGVHQLTEKECGEELPIVRQAIEIVLEDRVSAIKKRKQREDVAKLLAQRTNALVKSKK